MNDLLTCCGKGKMADQSVRLLFGRRVTAQELNPARLKRLDAGVLKRRGVVIRIRGRSSSLMQVDIAQRWFSSLRIIHLEPFTELVLLPHAVVEVEHIRRAVHRGNHFDIIRNDTKSEVEAVQRVLDIVQELTFINASDVVNLAGCRSNL